MPKQTYAGLSTDFAAAKRREYERDKERARVSNSGSCEEACFQECSGAAPGNEDYCRQTCASECAKADSTDGTVNVPIVSADVRSFGVKRDAGAESKLNSFLEKFGGLFSKLR